MAQKSTIQYKYNTSTIQYKYCDHLKQDHENLEERHQRFIIKYGHDGSDAQKGTNTIQMLYKYNTNTKWWLRGTERYNTMQIYYKYNTSITQYQYFDHLN